MLTKRFRTMQQYLPPLLLVVGLVMVIYGGTLNHDFLFNWDDQEYVTANEAVRGFTLPHLQTAFSRFFVGNYAPLQIVSYMLDYALWGMTARGFVLTNLLLHALNGFLAFLLFIALDVRRGVALLAAALFVAHPVQVESVAWISERKTLLAMMFFILSLLGYLRFSREEGRGTRFYLLSLVAFTCAMLSKAVVVTLPLLLVCLDWHRGGWLGVRKGVLNKGPFFLLALLMTAVTVISQREAGAQVNYLGNDPLNNAMTMMPVFVRYLGLLAWPASLSAIYKPPIKTALDLEVVFSGCVFFASLAAGLYLLYRRRLAGFAAAIFFTALLPFSHIFPLLTLMQDRYLYFPLLGVALLITSGVSGTAEVLAGARGRQVGLGICLLLVLLLGISSRERTGVWKNSLALWEDTAQKVPDSKQAWHILGSTRHELRDYAGAEQAYLRMLAIDPKDRDGLNALGVLYGEMGDLPRSLNYLRGAVQADPGSVGPLVNLGYATYLSNHLEESRGAFQQALQRDAGVAGQVLPKLVDIARRQHDGAEEARLREMAARLGIDPDR